MRENHGDQNLARARAHRTRAGEQNRLDILHTGNNRHHNGKHAVAHAESDFRRGSDAEDHHE